MKRLYISLFFIVVALNAFAQQPVISNISRTFGFQGQEVEITGSGFSTNPANLIIGFGGMNGTVVSSTSNFIQALVPFGATFSSVSVTHKTSGLTGFSSTQFFQTFPGEDVEAISISNRATFPNSKELFDLVIVDLDEDGKNDIVATKIDDTATDITIYRNTTVSNSITFAEQTVNIGNPTVNIAIGDVDGDGKIDLVISRGGSTNRNQIYVLRNTSTPGIISFDPAKSYFIPNGHFAKTVVIRDLDFDGKSEVIVSTTFDNDISIFKNNSIPGNINLEFTPLDIAILGATTTNGLAVADLNNDGKPDLITTQFLDNNVYIVPNESVDGNLIFGEQTILELVGNLNNVAIADLNLDGYPDILVTMPVQTKLAVFKNTGSGFVFESPETLDTGLNCWGIGLGDYTGNQKVDVVVTASSGNTFAFFKNISESGNIELTLTKTDIGQSLKTRNAAIGDINGDTKPDLAFSTFSSTTSELLVIRNGTCIEPILKEEDKTAEICPGQPPYRFHVAPAEGTIFIWKKSGTEVKNSTDPFFDTDVAGDYTVTAVTELGSCSIESAPFTLIVSPGGSIIPSDPVASNSGLACIGSSTQLFSTDVSGATYFWTGPNGFTSTDQNPTLSNITVEMSGIYYVIAEISPCKSASSSTIVEVITPPDFTIVTSGPTDFCLGNTITLSVASEIGYSYQWQKDGVDISGAITNAITTSDAGQYQVLVANVDCSLTSNLLTLNTFPKPSPTFSFSSILCINDSVQFTNTTTIEAGQTPTFTWDFGDGTSSTDENPLHPFTTANDYNVKLTVEYTGQSCVEKDSLTVTISSPDVLTITAIPAGSIPFCESESIEIEASGNFISYLWSTNVATAIIPVNNAGNYVVTATSASGCITKDSIDVTTNPLPEIIASARPDTVQLGQNSQLSVTGGISYIWTPEEGLDFPNAEDPIATLTTSTTYVVTGTDENGCMGTAEVSVVVLDTGNKLAVEAEAGFSPNGDGFFDTWEIKFIENFPDCEVVIFDRSGRIVFKSEESGYNNEWNGMDEQGNPLPVGAYFYTISCKDAKTGSGSVSIIGVN